MLASVAAMQGRIAMWHALGEAVRPLRLSMVAANVFTDPEIAAVGISQSAIDARIGRGAVSEAAARPKRAGEDGRRYGRIREAVRSARHWRCVGRRHCCAESERADSAVTMGVQLGLTVDQIAQSFSVYPSLSGSITEAGRQLMETHLD